MKVAASSVAASPFLSFASHARAATAAFGSASHMLVLYAKGGFRSHCLFNAVGTMQHNPFGAFEGSTGAEWTLGAAAGSTPYMSELGSVPSLAEIATEVAVLPCVDHMPGTDRVDVNHDSATNRICTGFADGTVGLLSLVGPDHPMYRNGFSADAVPPVEINPTPFGRGAREYAQTRPLSLQGADRSFSADLPVGQGWKIKARDVLNARYRDRRSRAYRSRLSEFLISKNYASVFSELLGDPRLNVLGDPMGADAGVTNGQMLSVLGNYTLNQIGDLQGIRSWGADIALALRFFGYGSPMAVVTRDIYDMHDNERTNFGPRTEDLARQIAGLNFLLKRMPHPKGGMFWDHTVVAVLSEFSRNNTMTGGFNSGNGSDHVGVASGPTRNQAIAVMGGPVKAGGKRIGQTDDQMRATGAVFSSRSLLATFLDVLGIDPNRYWNDAPIAELFA